MSRKRVAENSALSRIEINDSLSNTASGLQPHFTQACATNAVARVLRYYRRTGLSGSKLWFRW